MSLGLPAWTACHHGSGPRCHAGHAIGCGVMLAGAACHHGFGSANANSVSSWVGSPLSRDGRATRARGRVIISRPVVSWFWMCHLGRGRVGTGRVTLSGDARPKKGKKTALLVSVERINLLVPQAHCTQHHRCVPSSLSAPQHPHFFSHIEAACSELTECSELTVSALS